MPSKRAGRAGKRPAKPSRAPAPRRKGKAKASRAASLVRGRGGRPAGPSRIPRSAVRPAVRAGASIKTRALSRRELDEFRKLLEAERERLSEELEAIEEHLPEVEQVSVDTSGAYDEDLADVASDTFEREKGIAIENSVHDLLEQVEEALGRIEDGTFGVCEMCGQPIHPDRLRALPYARLCINCKAREEQAIHR